MAGDTNRVCHCVSTKHVNLNVCVDRKDGHSFVFGLFRYILMPLVDFSFQVILCPIAPFEILIAGTFLYKSIFEAIGMRLQKKTDIKCTDYLAGAHLLVSSF